MLSTIDIARAKGLKGQQLESTIRKARDDFMPNTQQNLKKDVYSHFILRLAYCRRRMPGMHAGPAHAKLSEHLAWHSEELRRWFLHNEVELFKWRFMNHPAEDRDGWLHRNNLKYQSARRALARAHPSRFAPWPSVCRAWQISREEYDSLRAELQQTMAARREDAEKITSERIEHYKVHAPAPSVFPSSGCGALLAGADACVFSHSDASADSHRRTTRLGM